MFQKPYERGYRKKDIIQSNVNIWRIIITRMNEIKLYFDINTI
jgi:hypothetical protein